MKLSEILRILNNEEENNIKGFYKHSSNNTILVVYVNIISWKSLKELQDRIIDITASEGEEDTIRVSFDRVEFD